MKKALIKTASKLTGDTENLRGDVTGLRGNVDECGLTRAERVQGVRITDLILETPDTPVAKG